MTTSPRLTLTDATLQTLGRMLRQDPYLGGIAWFDVETAEVIPVTSTYGLDEGERRRAARDPAQLTPAQLAERERVAAILATPPGRYLRVPIGADHGAGGTLASFAATLPPGPLRIDVLFASQGKGALRRVRSILASADSLDLLDAFEAREDRDAARAWLVEEGFDPGAFEADQGLSDGLGDEDGLGGAGGDFDDEFGSDFED